MTWPHTCGVDQNCDGIVQNMNLALVTTCGRCDNDCTKAGPNADWTCEADGNGGYQCVDHGCKPGWYECRTDDGVKCETYCLPTGSEVCNGYDDDCDCQTDEGVTADPRAACGVRTTTNPGCNPEVACKDGAWQCTFTDPDVCGGAAADCAGTNDDTCDNKDNDCDGVIDNAFIPQKGTACTKTSGACETTGILACDPLSKQLVCNAPDPVAQPETCNGKDDDCDGFVDETYEDLDSGAADGDFVRPQVVALGQSGPWIFAYEASRPDAADDTQGSGNGYFDVAPAGEGLDRTVACSERDKVPWTNVSPWEVEQTCEAIGGRVCRPEDWQDGCRGSANNCTFGFLGCQTASNYASGPYCNLGGYASGDDPGALLPTASAELKSCASPWAGNFGNDLNLLDITGNAREIVRCQRDRAVCVNCAHDCCSGTWSSVSGPGGNRTVCGSGLNNNLLLSGQPCSDNRHCCANDSACSTASNPGSSERGVCDNGICRNTTPGAITCVARGVACNADSNGRCVPYNVACCSDAPRSGGVCGGPLSVPYAVYPLLGGSYRTESEDSATCDYDFFKVAWNFRLFDTGFRCCFDEDPR